MSDKIDYRKTFVIPGINYQTFPIWTVDRSGRLVNFKEKVYPNSKSIKKYTRNKQLKTRSVQARIFDAFINVGYFSGLGEIVKEMPILIENSKRPKGLDRGLYFLCDYYFANIRLAVELDSEYHETEEMAIKDSLRDKYLLENFGITTFRISHLEKESVQRDRFGKDLVALLKDYSKKGVPKEPTPLIMTTDLFNTLKNRNL